MNNADACIYTAGCKHDCARLRLALHFALPPQTQCALNVYATPHVQRYPAQTPNHLQRHLVYAAWRPSRCLSIRTFYVYRCCSWQRHENTRMEGIFQRSVRLSVYPSISPSFSRSHRGFPDVASDYGSARERALVVCTMAKGFLTFLFWGKPHHRLCSTFLHDKDITDHY